MVCSDQQRYSSPEKLISCDDDASSDAFRFIDVLWLGIDPTAPAVAREENIIGRSRKLLPDQIESAAHG